jgi:hypothetical protein
LIKKVIDKAKLWFARQDYTNSVKDPKKFQFPECKLEGTDEQSHGDKKHEDVSPPQRDENSGGSQNQPTSDPDMERIKEAWCGLIHNYEERSANVVAMMHDHIAYIELLVQELAGRAPRVLQGLHAVWGSLGEQGKKKI